MANEEVLGPRKTMFVLVIVVGCFAVLWPRILSPLLLGSGTDQLQPNQFDRDAGCCEVMYEKEIAYMQLISEICKSSLGADGKLSPYAAADCRRSVNETCGVDLAAFLKRSENVGKTSRMLLETLKQSNSTCLRENFGVPVWSLSTHTPLNSWIQHEDTLKQERQPSRGGVGPHPALRERGRAIPPGAPTPPSRGPVPLPPHVRVRPSPLAGYFEIDVKPPPIPGMRPPLGSPGGPVPAPKTSMGFVMPIYTICIIVFFVYTLSKILFKRTGGPSVATYEPIQPDPQFRRRVFRDESRTTPDTKLVVTAISGLVAEVQQQMEASYAQNQQRQDVQDNHARPYTNGTVHNEAPVRIVATEYKERTPEPKEPTPEPKEPTPEPKEPTPEPKEPTPELREISPEPEDLVEPSPERTLPKRELKEATPELKEESPESKEISPEPEDLVEPSPEREMLNESIKKITEDLIEDAKLESRVDDSRQTTSELLEEALKEDEESEGEEDLEKSTVKVVGMECTAHSADGGAWPTDEAAVSARPSSAASKRPPEQGAVTSIFLETEIPQQSSVLVADFAADSPLPTKRSPDLVVSGKMTLSLIQDSAADNLDNDPVSESTFDEFTTASAVTQPAAEQKEEEDEELSEEEIEEEIEIEEVEEEVSEEEEDPRPDTRENTKTNGNLQH